MKHWKTTLVDASQDVLTAIKVIDKSGLQIALVVNADGKLLGTVTDGDVRRAILKGIPFNENVTLIMNPNPLVGYVNESKEIILQKMQSKSLHHIPILDGEGRVVLIELIEDLVEQKPRDNSVFLMAGGLGTRLAPLTNDYPKPLLKVGSKPILETIIENFVAYGFSKFIISVNYKSELITEYFGDGSNWGVQIDYVQENKRMGTAGALSLLPYKLTDSFFVMNADILTKINFTQLLDFHKENNGHGTMCVRQYESQVPYGVITMENNRLLGIEEKPVQQFFINAGIYVLEPETIDYIPKDSFFDMPSLFHSIMEKGNHASVFPVREYWLDIGQKDDFERANSEFTENFG